MKLVIDIPENLYNFVNTKRPNGYFNEFDKSDTYDISKFIRYGKSLNKELEDLKSEITDYSKTLEFINHTTFVSEEKTKRFIALEDIEKLITKTVLEQKGE